MIIIEKPELNLSPDSQRKIARLLVKMVNNGFKVVITTHSDYIIQELNNLVMLSNDFEDKEKFMKENDYSSDYELNPEQYKPYFFANNTVYAVPVAKYGAKIDFFNEEINNLADVSDDLSFRIDNTESGDSFE